MIRFHDEKLYLVSQGSYMTGGRVAYGLATESGELYLTITVNLPDSPLDPVTQSHVKSYSENEGLVETLVKEGLCVIDDVLSVEHVKVHLVTWTSKLVSELASARLFFQRSLGAQVQRDLRSVTRDG